MWFRTKQDVEYKVNDKFIGVRGMTREEATFKIQRKGFGGTRAGELCDALEALGLIKFEEEKPKTRELCSAHDGNDEFNFRVEQWFEKNGSGDKFVLWFNGEIVWRSWKA